MLPYPERVRVVRAARGMPQADRFIGSDALALIESPGLPPAVPDRRGRAASPSASGSTGLRADGRTTFATWVATHPAYLVSEPLRSPDRGLNFEQGDRSAYAPDDLRRVPGRRSAARPADASCGSRWPPRSPRGRACCVGGARCWSRGSRWPHFANPHGVVAWHSDGIETARHLTVPALQFHLGTLLALVAVVASAVPPRSRHQVAAGPDAHHERSADRSDGPPAASKTRFEGPIGHGWPHLK